MATTTSFTGERVDGVALAFLRASTRPVTPDQQDLAILGPLGKLPSRTPSIVAAAKLRDAWATALGLPPPTAAPEHQIAYLREVVHRVAGKLPAGPLTAAECDAWMRHWQYRGRLAALVALALCAGDVVQHTGRGTVSAVSSVSPDGTVWLRGPARAWPDQLQMVARVTDTSAAADKARVEARNSTVKLHTRPLSSAHHRALLHHQVPAHPTNAVVDELRRVVDEATDEKPIQAFLATHRELLACLMRGPFRYVLPQVRFNDKFVADFLTMDDDSTGPRWLFVELESPRAPVTLKSSKELAKAARHGKSQVKEWRDLVRLQLHSLSQPASQGGSNLFGIRHDSEGLVLVGRRTGLEDNHASVRRQDEAGDRIMVHTYDWLIEVAAQAAAAQTNFPIGTTVLQRPEDRWS